MQFIERAWQCALSSGMRELVTQAFMADALRLFSVVGAWLILKVVQAVMKNGPGHSVLNNQPAIPMTLQE